MSKLCQSLACTIQFTNRHCYIHVIKSLQMIGLVNQVNGLYQLKMEDKLTYHTNSMFIHRLKNANTLNTSQCNHSILRSSLWHFRLGHLSFHIMSYMYQLYSTITHYNKVVCDICHFSKKKEKKRKMPFKVITSRAI